MTSDSPHIEPGGLCTPKYFLFGGGAINKDHCCCFFSGVVDLQNVSMWGGFLQCNYTRSDAVISIMSALSIIHPHSAKRRSFNHALANIFGGLTNVISAFDCFFVVQFD